MNNNFPSRANKYVIGIDPDLTKSGIALWSKGEKKIIHHSTETFPCLIELRIKPWIEKYGIENLVVKVEGGWINSKANFRLSSSVVAAREKVAKDVGQNHGTGKNIVEYLKFLGLKVDVIKPTNKGGDKVGSAYTTEGKKNFEKTYKFKVGQVNDEERDAIAMCYGY